MLSLNFCPYCRPRSRGLPAITVSVWSAALGGSFFLSAAPASSGRAPAATAPIAALFTNSRRRISFSIIDLHGLFGRWFRIFSFWARMLERQLAAAPLAFGVVLQLGVLFRQVDDGIVTLIDVQFKPITFDALLGDADAGSQAAAMVAAGAVAGDQRCHQAVGQAALGLFIRFGHRDNYLAAGERVALAGVEPAGHGAPIAAVAWSCGRVAIGSAAFHIDDGELPTVPSLIILEQLAQHFFRQLALFEQIKSAVAELRIMVVLRAESADAGADIRHDLADRRVLAGDGRAADPGFRIDGIDGKGCADFGLAFRGRFALAKVARRPPGAATCSREGQQHTDDVRLIHAMTPRCTLKSRCSSPSFQGPAKRTS